MKKINEYEVDFCGKIHNLSKFKIEERLLNMFLYNGVDALKKINGEYSLCIKNTNTKEQILIRDKMGIASLYYTILNNNIYFANRVEDLIKISNITPIIDKESIKMLFGIGPAKEEGKTFIKNIYEVKPGHCYIFKDGKLLTLKYFDYINNNNLDTKENAKENIKNILEDSIKIRSKNKNVCVMLSGGLDSSLVTTLLNKNDKKIKSFSVNYENNDKDFKANKYQKTKDSDYIKLVLEKNNLNHKNIIISKNELVENLQNALCAREFPGMGDIDSSLYVFLNKIKEENVESVFTGECADEIFLGYPWLYENINNDIIPFINNLNLREKIIKPGILKENELKNYTVEAYNNIIEKLDNLDEYKKKNYLTIKLFMPVLVERIQKLSNYLGVNVEVPFADYRIFEYLFNLPFDYKINNVYNEKSLLKEIYKDKLPSEIIVRKKSPYPKTYDINYAKKVESILLEIIENKNSKIHEIIDTSYLKKIIENEDKSSVDKNFFGQLMTYPQFLAYIIQIEMWLNKYKIKFENN